jgi:hypothetical protein
MQGAGHGPPLAPHFQAQEIVPLPRLIAACDRGRLHVGGRLRRLSRVDCDQRVRGPPLGHSGAGLRGAARALCRPRTIRRRLGRRGQAARVSRGPAAPRPRHVPLGARAHGARDARFLVRRRHRARAARLDRFRRRPHRGITRLARRLRGDRPAEPDLDRQLVPFARRRPAHRRARRDSAAVDRHAEGRRGPAVR